MMLRYYDVVVRLNEIICSRKTPCPSVTLVRPCCPYLLDRRLLYPHTNGPFIWENASLTVYKSGFDSSDWSGIFLHYRKSIQMEILSKGGGNTCWRVAMQLHNTLATVRVIGINRKWKRYVMKGRWGGDDVCVRRHVLYPMSPMTVWCDKEGRWLVKAIFMCGCIISPLV